MRIKINDKPTNVDRRDYDRDTVTQKHTAFGSFIELVNAKGGYRPSVYLGGKGPKAQRELLFLTFEYNMFQHGRGDSRRVFKGDWQPIKANLHPMLKENYGNDQN